MNEFRFVGSKLSGRRNDLSARLELWGIVVGLLSIGLFASYGSRQTIQRFSIVLSVLAGFLVVSAIVLAFMVAFRHAREKAASEWSFILTDENLIKKRKGRPDIIVPLGDITELYFQNSYLVVKSSTLGLRIDIPKEIEGFDTLQKALGSCKTPSSRSSGIFRLARTLLYAVCCAFVLWSRQLPIVLLASVIGFMLLGLQSLSFYNYIKHKPQTRYAGVAFICFEWMSAVLIAFFRLIHS